MKIKIVDSICGSGKTSAIIEMIKNDTSNNKYIYITPFLTEVKRIKDSCKNKHFCEPKYTGKGNKSFNFNNLILKGKNIVSTHALFQKATQDTIALIKSNNYILILDEVFNVVEQLNISKDDINLLFEQKMIKEENGYILWLDDNYNGEFNYLKYLAQNKSLIMWKDTILIWMFPVEVFKAFNDAYILTYLFEGQEQCYYYKMNGIEYDYYYATKENNKFVIKKKDENYKIIDKQIKENLKNKINIIQNDKLNSVGSGNNYELSHNWFRNEENKDMVKQLKNNIYNVFNNIFPKEKQPKRHYENGKEIKSEPITLWTTFLDQKNRLKGKGYTKTFLSCTSRATNVYSKRYNIAYCLNVFNNPFIQKFFQSNGININQDLYALSELIQFIFRSRIRNNENIKIFIPSIRMRTLLINWLENLLP